ncbi:MAG: translational GTPase TypA [Phycisphaerales bacterium]
MMTPVAEKIRNIAIIAHVDHGKTTLVDQMLRQCGQFRQAELKGERILDSNDIERERGITILSKNCAIRLDDLKINLIDTPGHADFGGEVERVLRLADGCLLLVDAFEGPMPQTNFVLRKAFEAGLRPIVVINKMDRPDARAPEVVDEVLDLFIDLGADDAALEFPVVYASGVNGWASRDPDTPANDIRALFDVIRDFVPAPEGKSEAPLQLLITTLDHNDYVGRIGIGRVFAGRIEIGDPIIVIDRHGAHHREKVGGLYSFDGLGRVQVDSASAGDIVAVFGVQSVGVGATIADPESPEALPPVRVEEPTLRMAFRVNDSPTGGKSGKFVTSRHLRDRLEKESQRNVAMRVEPGETPEEFLVSGRGLLHLSVLIENMRREGYEMTVGKPRVIFHTNERGEELEPIERLVVDAPASAIGPVMELVGARRGVCENMENVQSRSFLEFNIPTRGLIGLRTRMLTATNGEANMSHVFLRYEPKRGEVPSRQSGALIASEPGQVTTYALDGLADRGVMFVKPGDQVYDGQIVGEHNRENDLEVNVVRGRKLTNIRAASADKLVVLRPPREMTLEMALEFIDDDELVEVTPEGVRLRKRLLSANERKREKRRGA